MPELTNDITDTETLETDRTDAIGYVYILFRPDNPGLAKVGYTAVSPQARASNYTDGDWKVHREFPMPVWLARLSERTAHKNLRSYWLDPKITGGTASEIFTCPLDIAENAVELAFIEQLEKVLNSLKVPSFVAELVLNKHGIIEYSDIGTLTKTIEEKEKKIQVKIQETQNQFLEREEFLKNQIISLEKQIEQSNKNLTYYKNKYSSMTEHIENIQKLSQKELCINANELKRFYDKKINYSQFELLRENFRKAVDLIEAYQLRESMKE